MTVPHRTVAPKPCEIRVAIIWTSSVVGPFGVRSEANGPENEPDSMPKRSYIMSLIQMPCSPAPSSWLRVAQVGSGCQMAPRRPFIYPHYPRDAKHIPSIYLEYSQYIPRIFYILYPLANQYKWLLTITNDNKSWFMIINQYLSDD